MFFENFDKTCTIPSNTTSCVASFEISDIIIDKHVVRSSRVLTEDIFVMFNPFPCSSIPSSIKSLMLTNNVSGKRDHKPGFDMCKSPDK